MKLSDKLKMKLIDDLINENIEETLNSFSNNFEIIDNIYEERIPNIESLEIGSEHDLNKIYYNTSPSVGDYVGWVNLNGGHYAPKRRNRTEYQVGDLRVPEINNGHVYECVANGISAPKEPLFPTTSNSTINDTHMGQAWIAEHNYSVGDVVLTSDETIYFECVTAGLSGIDEPSWNINTGTTLIDGSVVWLKNKTVIWQEYGSSANFRPFGKID